MIKSSPNPTNGSGELSFSQLGELMLEILTLFQWPPRSVGRVFAAYILMAFTKTIIYKTQGFTGDPKRAVLKTALLQFYLNKDRISYCLSELRLLSSDMFPAGFR